MPPLRWLHTVSKRRAAYMKPDPADTSQPHSDTPETPAAGRNPYHPGIESCCSSHCYSSPPIHKSAECECRKFQIPPAPSAAGRRRAHTQFPPAAQNSSLAAASSPPPARADYSDRNASVENSKAHPHHQRPVVAERIPNSHPRRKILLLQRHLPRRRPERITHHSGPRKCLHVVARTQAQCEVRRQPRRVLHEPGVVIAVRMRYRVPEILYVISRHVVGPRPQRRQI